MMVRQYSEATALPNETRAVKPNCLKLKGLVGLKRVHGPWLRSTEASYPIYSIRIPQNGQNLPWAREDV